MQHYLYIITKTKTNIQDCKFKRCPNKSKEPAQKKELFFQVERPFQVDAIFSDIAHTELEPLDVQKRILDFLQVALVRTVGQRCNVERKSTSVIVESITLWLDNTKSNTLNVKWSYAHEDLASFVLGTVNTVLYAKS